MSSTPIDPVKQTTAPEPLKSVAGKNAPQSGRTAQSHASGAARAQDLARLRQQIANGSYVVDAAQLAVDLIRTRLLK